MSKIKLLQHSKVAQVYNNVRYTMYVAIIEDESGIIRTVCMVYNHATGLDLVANDPSSHVSFAFIDKGIEDLENNKEYEVDVHTYKNV